MKIGNYDVNLKNIQAYIQGNLRYLAEQYGPEFIRMEQHIREQVMFRKDIARPDCIEDKKCKECHCDIPELFYADKQCGGECYPEMMSKERWEEFKKTLRIYTLENKIDRISYPFDWDKIIEIMDNKQEEIKEKETLITGDNATKIEDVTVNLGDKYINDMIIHTFSLHNHNDVNVFVKNVSTSCGCTTADEMFNKIFPANTSIDVEVKINTKDKREAKNSVFITELLFNNNTKTKLTIICNLIKRQDEIN